MDDFFRLLGMNGAFMFLQLIAVVYIGSIVFWVWMLWDAYLRKDWGSSDKRTLWLAILVLSLFAQAFWLSALAYYLTIKRPRDGALTRTTTKPARSKR